MPKHFATRADGFEIALIGVPQSEFDYLKQSYVGTVGVPIYYCEGQVCPKPPQQEGWTYRTEDDTAPVVEPPPAEPAPPPAEPTP